MDIRTFCLGTAKLGMPEYGFSSSPPDPSFDPLRFLKEAANLCIQRFDTSPRYGASENILGQHVSRCEKAPWISSKIDNLKTDSSKTLARMQSSVKTSLNRLHRSKLDVCYLHQNDLEILSDQYVQMGLRNLKNKRLISHTGASIYTKEECEYAIECKAFDYIQIPANIFDISIYNEYVMEHQENVHFSVRSILLQGILINRHSLFRRIGPSKRILAYLEELDRIATHYEIPLLEMALSFVFSLPGIDHFILGSTSIDHLKRNLRYINRRLPMELHQRLYALAVEPKAWANPKQW